MDVTERRTAEEKIREHVVELWQMLDFTPRLVAVFGSNHERLYNRGALASALVLKNGCREALAVKFILTIRRLTAYWIPQSSRRPTDICGWLLSSVWRASIAAVPFQWRPPPRPHLPSTRISGLLAAMALGIK